MARAIALHRKTQDSLWSETSERSLYRRLWDLAPYVSVVHLCSSTCAALFELHCLALSGHLLGGGFWIIALRISLRIVHVAGDALRLLWLLPFAVRSRGGHTLCPPCPPGPNGDSVDVIITVCLENQDVVVDTLRAACAIDYPADQYRVIVADDGADRSLRSLVDSMRREYGNLYYFARSKTAGVHHKFKAGNINSTLQWTSTLAGGPAAWVAVLDVDMLPQPEWLRVLLSHARQDPQIGMAVPPQDFYNIPTNDILFQSTESQFVLDEPVRNRFSGAWCSGSGFLARRAAIESIGGFPDTSLSEDILCSMKLNAAGWRVIFVNEKLQWGLMPDSIDSHAEQRRRWAVGSVQNALQLRFCLDPRIVSKMTLPQRLQGFHYCVAPFISYLVVSLGFAVAPWALVLGNFRLLAPTPTRLRYLLLVDLIRRCTNFAYQLSEMTALHPCAVAQKKLGSGWLAPLISASIVTEMTSRRLPFISSGSIKSVMAERHAAKRASLNSRLGTLLLHPRYRWSSLVALNAIVCVGIRIFLDAGTPVSRRAFAETVLLMNSVLDIEDFVTFAIPVLYLIFPPSMPRRRALMEFDHKTKTWRPKKESRGVRWNFWAVWTIAPAVAAIAFSAMGVLSAHG